MHIRQQTALVTNIMKGHSTIQPDKAHFKSTDDNSGDRGRCIQSPSRLCLDQLWWVRNNALLSFLVCTTYVLAHLTFRRAGGDLLLLGWRRNAAAVQFDRKEGREGTKEAHDFNDFRGVISDLLLSLMSLRKECREQSSRHFISYSIMNRRFMPPISYNG